MDGALGLSGVEGLLTARGEGCYGHGESLSIADICLVPQVYNARRRGVDLHPFPRARQISAALEDLAAVRAAPPDRTSPSG